MKLAGGAYLIWLGIQALRAAGHGSSPAGQAATGGRTLDGGAASARG